MGLLKLFVNRSTGTLASSVASPRTYVIPPLTQGDTVSIDLSVVEGDPLSGVGRVSLVNIGSYSLKVGFGAQPIGNGSITPAALQTSWSKNADNTQFSGSLSLNTAEVTTLIGTASSYKGWLEVELTEVATGNSETIYAAPVTINANLVTALSSTPLEGDVALGVGAAAATYVKRQGAAGEGIVLTSPDGTKSGVLYWGDDGTLHAETLT